MVREQAFPVETANSVPALVEFFLDHNLGKARTDYVKSECACKCGALARVDGIGADSRLFPLSSLPAPPSDHLWRHACTGGKSTRSEIVKLGALHKLVETADKGDKQSCYHALGCLTQFLETEDFKTLIMAYTGAKLIRCLGDGLVSVNHPRTQAQASQILFSIAENPETTARLLPVVNKLVEAVHVSGPSWVKQVQVCTQVCQVLTRISNIEQELSQSTLTTGGYSGSKKSSARRDMVSLGIVTNCLEVLKVPTPPAKPKEEGAPDGPPQVSPEVAVKVAALATLHSLLDEPTCMDELRKIKGSLSRLSGALSIDSVDAKGEQTPHPPQSQERR